MIRNLRKMSYARLAAISHAPEVKAELERRRLRRSVRKPSGQPNNDYDLIVRDTVDRVRSAILAKILSNLGLPSRG